MYSKLLNHPHLIIFLLVIVCVAKTSFAKPALIKARPSIIALSPHLVEMLYAVGAGDQIIATSEYSDYPAAAKKIPRVGNYLHLQIERIIALQPDYIFAWRNGSPSADLARLTQLGFHIIYSDPKKLVDIAKEIKHFATLAGHRKVGILKANKFLSRLAAIKRQYQHKRLIPIFYELWPTPLSTIAKGSWPQQYLDICRAHNVFYNTDMPYPTVNIEQVITKPIDLIIVPLSKNQTDKHAYKWAKWPEIKAVKNKQFIYPNADEIHRMTLRSIDSLADLCQQIDKSRTFYKQRSSAIIN